MSVDTPTKEVRLRFLLRERDVRNSQGETVLSVYRDHGVVPKASRDDNFNKTPIDTSSYKLVCRGDLVINKMKAWQGSLAVTKYQGIVSGDYMVCEIVDPGTDPRFLHYLLRSSHMRQEYGIRSTGIRPSQWRLYWDDLADIRVKLFSLQRQREIADFLDAETARIDALVAKKCRLASLLTERQVLLVRKELDGVERILPLRRVVSRIQTGTTPTGSILEDPQKSDIEWFTPADLGPGLNVRPSERRLDVRALQERAAPKFPGDSVLIVGIGATAGKVAHLDREGSSNQQITCIVSNPLLSARLLAWQLSARTDELRSTAPYTTLPILNNDFLLSLPVRVPPKNHQQGILRRLDEADADATVVTRRLGQQLNLLAEHRQALITAAVTGQLKVPGVTA